VVLLNYWVAHAIRQRTTTEGGTATIKGGNQVAGLREQYSTPSNRRIFRIEQCEQNPHSLIYPGYVPRISL